MINIHTDSTADLGNDLAKQFHINIIPLYVILDDKSYLDGVEIGIQDLFQSVQRTGKLPKTSATSVADFTRCFSEPGDHVYIGISSRLSATVKNAQLASDALARPGIYIIDSLNLSTGIGLLAISAAELRDEGLPADEIARRISGLVPKVRTSFILETLDYLYKGGRCSALQNVLGSLLHIRPVIAVLPDGSLGLKDRIRGTRQKTLSALLDDFRKNIDMIDMRRVFITHTGCDDDAELLKNELLKIAPVQEVCITYAGSVIASHCGAGTIGILYLTL
jgi:DegV family protein with EDD domain